jgi:hypothetical protein
LTYKQKIPIGGIKFSEERVHYTITRPHTSPLTINDLLQHIHSKQVNIPFLSHTSQGGSDKACFCVSKNDADSMATIEEITINNEIEMLTQYQVGSVAIFPHKKELAFIGIIMSLIENLQLPVYSCGTSISAYIFNTRFDALSTVAEQLTDIFALPENHSPFHQQFQLRQPRSITAL